MKKIQKSATHPFTESELPDLIAGAKSAAAGGLNWDLINAIDAHIDSVEEKRKPKITARPTRAAKGLF
jgi:hypothetical protein